MFLRILHSRLPAPIKYSNPLKSEHTNTTQTIPPLTTLTFDASGIDDTHLAVLTLFRSNVPLTPLA